MSFSSVALAIVGDDAVRSFFGITSMFTEDGAVVIGNMLAVMKTPSLLKPRASKSPHCWASLSEAVLKVFQPLSGLEELETPIRKLLADSALSSDEANQRCAKGS